MSLSSRRTPDRIRIALMVILGFNLLLWCATRDVTPRWAGVPPVPGWHESTMLALGDTQFSYRYLTFTLQNLGSTGADDAQLKDYDYAALEKWFFLLSDLDPVSDSVPALAAYYFGATRAPKDVASVVRYLAFVGQVPVGEKWRWLAQAAYLAQHRMYDVDLALKLAYRLSRMPNADTMPQWARQMPAFVLQKKGDREAARQLMENMLLTQKNLAPEEIENMKFFLTEQLGIDAREVEATLKKREAAFK